MSKVGSLRKTNIIVHERFVSPHFIQTLCTFLLQMNTKEFPRFKVDPSYTQRAPTCAAKLGVRGKNVNERRRSLDQGCHAFYLLCLIALFLVTDLTTL